MKEQYLSKTMFSNIPDYCTGNKYIEDGFLANDSGICYLKCLHLQERVQACCVCNYPVLINRKIANSGDSSYDKYELLYKKGNNWLREIISAKALVNPSMLQRIMNKIELQIDLPTLMSRYLLSIVKNNDLSEVSITNHLGK